MHFFMFNLAAWKNSSVLQLALPPFGRITGIRFYGYNLSPLFLGTPIKKSTLLHSTDGTKVESII
jgi:hypothetical protein